MDPRDRADAMLARARARRAYVVTPEDAVSPMDAANTLQIPQAVVAAVDDQDDEEPTSSMPAPQPPGLRDDPELTDEPRTQPLHMRPPAPAAPVTRSKPTDRQMDGLLPTVQQPHAGRPSLSERLGGE